MPGINLNRKTPGQVFAYCKLILVISPFLDISLSFCALSRMLSRSFLAQEYLRVVPEMAPSGQKVQVLKPCWLKRGYFFQTCRSYRSPSGLQYDYCLFNAFGKQLKLQERGARSYLSYNFRCKTGQSERIEVHRLFAFNSHCNLRNHPYRPTVHVHHMARPRSKPWTNCTSRNMVVMSKKAHKEWHKKHPGVAHSLR